MLLGIRNIHFGERILFGKRTSRLEDENIWIILIAERLKKWFMMFFRMPYRPPLRSSGMPEEKRYTYRLSSYTCLAGDIIGDYSFDEEKKVDDRLYFEDMAIYSMVKNNTFNGIPLPDIAVMDESGECKVIRSFSYEDFKGRLS